MSFSLTQNGIVVEIDSKDPNRVKTDICSGKFRKVLEICTRHSTSMISNDTQSQPEHSISQYYWLFYSIVVEEIKIFFNLP